MIRLHCSVLTVCLQLEEYLNNNISRCHTIRIALQLLIVVQRLYAHFHDRHIIVNPHTLLLSSLLSTFLRRRRAHAITHRAPTCSFDPTLSLFVPMITLPDYLSMNQRIDDLCAKSPEERCDAERALYFSSETLRNCIKLFSSTRKHRCEISYATENFYCYLFCREY